MLRFLEVKSKLHFLSNIRDKLIILAETCPYSGNGMQTTLIVDDVVTYGGVPIENEFFAPSIISLTLLVFANYPELFKIR